MSIHRRDVLLFRVAPAGRTADLLCQQLYLRSMDAQCGASDEDAIAYEPWMGEPPLVRDRATTQDLIRGVNRDLQDCRVLRVFDAEWLGEGDLRTEVDVLVDLFRSRGGEVLFLRSSVGERRL